MSRGYFDSRPCRNPSAAHLGTGPGPRAWWSLCTGLDPSVSGKCLTVPQHDDAGHGDDHREHGRTEEGGRPTTSIDDQAGQRCPHRAAAGHRRTVPPQGLATSPVGHHAGERLDTGGDRRLAPQAGHEHGHAQRHRSVRDGRRRRGQAEEEEQGRQGRLPPHRAVGQAADQGADAPGGQDDADERRAVGLTQDGDRRDLGGGQDDRHRRTGGEDGQEPGPEPGPAGHRRLRHGVLVDRQVEEPEEDPGSDIGHQRGEQQANAQHMQQGRQGQHRGRPPAGHATGPRARSRPSTPWRRPRRRCRTGPVP